MPTRYLQASKSEGYAAEDRVVMRHLALNMLKNELAKESIQGRRLRFRRDQNFLMSVLSTVLSCVYPVMLMRRRCY